MTTLLAYLLLAAVIWVLILRVETLEKQQKRMQRSLRKLRMHGTHQPPE